MPGYERNLLATGQSWAEAEDMGVHEYRSTVEMGGSLATSTAAEVEPVTTRDATLDVEPVIGTPWGGLSYRDVRL